MGRIVNARIGPLQLRRGAALRLRGRLGLRRQPEMPLLTLDRLADEPDATPVQPQDLTSDRKAEARAARPVAGGSDAVVRSHAGPAIAHRDLDLARALGH